MQSWETVEQHPLVELWEHQWWVGGFWGCRKGEAAVLQITSLVFSSGGEDRAQPASASCIHSSKLPVVQEFICQTGQKASKEHRSGLNLPPLLVLPQQKNPKQTALAEQGLYQKEGESRQLGCGELPAQGRQPWLCKCPLGKGDSSRLALSFSPKALKSPSCVRGSFP